MKFRNEKSKTNNRQATCPSCGFGHWIDGVNWNLFGPDCWCMKCTDRSHVDFMRRNAKRFKMTCVPNCPCGFGADPKDFYAK